MVSASHVSSVEAKITVARTSIEERLTPQQAADLDAGKSLADVFHNPAWPDQLDTLYSATRVLCHGDYFYEKGDFESANGAIISLNCNSQGDKTFISSSYLFEDNAAGIEASVHQEDEVDLNKYLGREGLTQLADESYALIGKVARAADRNFLVD